MPLRYKKIVNRSISSADMARLLGLETTRIAVLAQEGVLVKSARGLYEDAASVIGYISYVKRSMAAKYEGRSEELRSRAIIAREKARMATMERQHMEGSRIDIEEVKAALTSALVPLKTNILALGAKVAPLIVRAKTPAEAMIIINQEAERCLEAVCAELSRLEKSN